MSVCILIYLLIIYFDHSITQAFYTCMYLFYSLSFSYTYTKTLRSHSSISSIHKLFVHICASLIYTKSFFMQNYYTYISYSLFTSHRYSCTVSFHSYPFAYTYTQFNSFMQWVDSYTYHNHSYEGYIHKRILCTHNLFLPVYPFRLFILVYYTYIISIQSYEVYIHIQHLFVFSLAQIFVYQEISITDSTYSIHLINSFKYLVYAFTHIFLSQNIVIHILNRLVYVSMSFIYSIHSFELLHYAFSHYVHSYHILIHIESLLIHTR